MDAAIADLLRPFLDEAQIAASRTIMGFDTQLMADKKLKAGIRLDRVLPARRPSMTTHRATGGPGCPARASGVRSGRLDTRDRPGQAPEPTERTHPDLGGKKP